MGLASRGLRDMDSGREAITDPAEAAQVRAQGRRVSATSIVVAAVLTCIALAFPG